MVSTNSETIPKKPIIFFDIDNTLYDYDFSHNAGLMAAYNVWKAQTDDSFEVFKEKYGVARNWVKRLLMGRASVHSRALYFQKMIELYLPQPDTNLILELIDDYWGAALNNMHPYPGVVQTISTLKEKGYQLAVITNMMAELQYKKLSKLKLNNYFNRIISSEEVGHEKPHPHIFSHALNVFKVAAKDAWMIGDSFDDDIEPTSWLGMNAIWFNPGNLATPSSADKQKFFQVKSIEEIIPIIEKHLITKPEGVIKYSLQFNKKLKSLFSSIDVEKLSKYRDVAHKNNLIGVYPPNHPDVPNIGFGNISQRYSKDGQFIITASQTGHLATLLPDQFALVTDYSIDTNTLYAKGNIPPSSEAMTHAAIYEVASDVEFILHVHHPKLWQYAKDHSFLSTPADVPYGTPQMGRAVQEVYLKHKIMDQIVVMLGHKDGLIIWGSEGEHLLSEFLTKIKMLTEEKK